MSLDKINAMSKDDIIAKAAGLLEFGNDRTAVVDKWAKVAEEREFQPNPIAAVAALNNADLNKALLALIKAEPEKVLQGLCIAAKAVEADVKILCLPKEEEALAKELADLAAQYEVQIEMGMVNVRSTRGGAYHHFQTLIALAQIMDGAYEAGTYVAVCKDGKTSEPKKIPYGTKVADIIGDTAEVFAVAIGNKLYNEEALEMVIEEATNVGNGVITVYSDKCCMVNEAATIEESYRKASCGKCTFCREGLIQISAMLKDITEGRGEKSHTSIVQEIGEAMSFSTQCSLGETAAEFALDSIKNFGSEYNDHIKKKKCRANVCSAFSSIYIDPNDCIGCGDCMDECPKEAIEGKSGYIHMIDEYECDKCGKCIAVCEEEAIIITTGRVPKLPTRLVKVGKFKKH